MADVVRVVPKVPFALTLGVTGHRAAALPGASLARLRQRMASVIADIERAARLLARREAGYFAECEPAFIIVSPLADGADQLATEAAMAQGFALQCVLPFPRTENRADFDDDEARACHDALLGRAASILELPGERADSFDAYIMAGRATVAHCDILLAVWDGLPPRGRGGTGEVVELAIARGTPVVHIPVDDEAPVLLMWSAFDPSVLTQRCEAAASRPFDSAQIARLLDALFAPPSDPRERAFLDQFHGERKRRWRMRFEYPAMLALAGVKGLSARDWRDEHCATAAGEEWRAYRGACAGPHGIQAALDLVEEAYVWSDRLANRYAQYYRSGHVFNFLLAAIAGIVGLSGLVIEGGQIALPIVEFTLVLAIIVNTRVGLRQEWHRRWLDYRQLAERLRPMRSLKLLAVAAPDPPGSATNPVARRWVDWYAASVWRALACPDGAIDHRGVTALAGSIRQHEILPQVDYHRRGARFLEDFDAWIERIGMALFLATIVLCVGGLVAALAAPAWASGMNDWFVFFSASLPVIGGAMFGIRVQGEFQAGAARSTASAQVLQQIADELGGERISLNRAGDLVEQAARAMFADLDEWRMINARHDLAVG